MFMKCFVFDSAGKNLLCQHCQDLLYLSDQELINCLPRQGFLFGEQDPGQNGGPGGAA